ncbi:uncharacterized protein LOC126727380 isoform X1 [Quercus robur]|uniref:uncharacterized protein LOC126727380 isoform X1 n=1 Tax=Quercus robur TaxID=38942 RepID=UPI0021634568|nr:uncharacterized protein LOC126727380 isoform X1 [Quercus robur]
MQLPIPNIVKELWNAWNLRSCIFLSLWLQAILVLFAFLRKRTRSKLVHGLIWFAYLLADWIAPVAIGLISKSEGVGCEAKGNKDLMAFWASFLLLHFGGPDTITSFALEDNEFWLRHLVGLILQIVATAYIFYQSLPNNFWAPTIMVFLVGCIKYGERTRALFLASLNQFGCSVLPKPEPGSDYEEIMEMHFSNTLEQVETQVDVMPSLEDENLRRSYSVDKALISANGPESKGERKPLDNLQLIQEAHRLFEKYKGLIVGLLFSSKDREESRDLFLTRTPAEAFRLIECELNFMYEYLHTKVVVVRCPFGYFLRFISFTLIIVALGLFSIEHQHNFHHASKLDNFDVILTYVLLVGALGLEAISVLMLILSDRTLLAVKVSRSKLVEKFLKRRRWSKSVSQYDMINYCLKDSPTWAYTLASYVGAGGVLEKMTILFFSHSKEVSEALEIFIFKELRWKASNAKNIKAARDASSQRGYWALLQTSSCFELKWSIGEYQYEESLLLWHMATELLYIEDTQLSIGNDSNTNRETCKLLSDYMFYLLVMKPKMMAPVLGNWQIVFQDTCAEAKRFFHKESNKAPISDKVEACKRILAVETKYRSVELKGRVSNSVFFDGSLLAKQLKELKTDKWMLMNRVWVELMSYAAINCRPIVHAQQPSKGGELLTFIWLLMNHLGFGTQFYEQERQAKAKMVPRK